MPESPLLIARATAADAEEIAALSRAVFVGTFVKEFGIRYVPEELEAFLAEGHSAEAYRRHIAAADEAVWTARAGGALAGFAAVGPNSLPMGEAADGELYRLYVDPAHRGAGAAGRLMDEVMAWLPKGRPAWLSVWSENIRAQRFYHRYGFAKAGEYGYRVGSVVDREFIYGRLAD